MSRSALITLAALFALACTATPAGASGTASPAAGKRADVRFASFNASLNRSAAGQLVSDLSNPGADTVQVRQARNVAEVIQRSGADVILINEFDYYPDGRAAELFRDNFLKVSQNGAPAADYPYYFTAPSNTGVPSGFDLDNNGDTNPNDAGNDAFGFGVFPGQFGMVVFSKHPIDSARARTFQNFRWKDMPGARLPDDPGTPQPADWYSPAELAEFPLSSKSHWDVPIRIGHKTVHFLISHPTPPTFDAAEDRNGTRNHDEIRFWADPVDGDSVDGAIDQLLGHPRIIDPLPASTGGSEAVDQGGNSAGHKGDPQLDTSDFGDFGAFGPGHLRVDYDKALYGPTGVPTSDHRLVCVDLRY